MLKYLIYSCFMVVILLSESAFSGQVNCFIYHRFDNPTYPSTNISAEVFRQQLEYLQRQQIAVLSLEEVAARLAAGDPLPEESAALAVDDAYRTFYDVAMPLIREYRMPVTLFVNTDAVGTPGYMNWDELRELAAEGVEIGNHTASHAYLVERRPDETQAAWEQRIRNDILRAQDAFAEHLGMQPSLFAYPYGEYSPEVVGVVEQLGFTAAFAQQSGVIHEGHPRYTLPRFPMGGPFATLQGFRNKLSMGPLRMAAEIPEDPVIREQNPPALVLRIADTADVSPVFNCFVQGDNSCRVESDPNRGPGWYRVVADKPLSGRRNKYTLTAQARSGGWLWYSHPWILAEQPAVSLE